MAKGLTYVIGLRICSSSRRIAYSESLLAIPLASIRGFGGKLKRSGSIGSEPLVPR